MAHLLVAGLINVETTLKVERFPIDYEPIRYPFFGLNTTVSGVGYNITKALTTLGNEVRFLALTGRDLLGRMVIETLQDQGLPSIDVIANLDQTPQSCILFDPDGKRMINTDLKHIQESNYPLEFVDAALAHATLAVICNINFARPFLARARAAGVPIATDIHAISSLDDAYNADFMRESDILFQSHERLPCLPEEWLRQVFARYKTPLLAVGMGAEGVLLAVDGHLSHIPAVTTRPVVNTVGAGDSLFAAFVHGYVAGLSPLAAMQRAVIFASWKIGENGGAAGFLNAADLEELAG
jgi:ribokinase